MCDDAEEVLDDPMTYTQEELESATNCGVAELTAMEQDFGELVERVRYYDEMPDKVAFEKLMQDFYHRLRAVNEEREIQFLLSEE